MSAYRDKRSGDRWRYRKMIRLPDGSRVRIEGTPNIDTKEAAERAEREHIRRKEEEIRNPPPAKPKEVTTFAAFAKTFMATYAATNNKPSEVESKRSILDNHLTKAFGSKRLDEINAQDVEDLKAKMLRTTSAKYVNNVLNVLRKILRYAADLELVVRVPTMKALKLPPSKHEFLDFDDFAKLVEAARQEPELYAAVLLAGEAGLRLGEIVGLHWSDIDRAGVLTVTHNDWRGHLGSPKSGRARELPLTRRTLDAVRALRHLRGPRVFCNRDGTPWTVTMMRTGLLRQEKRAGLAGRGKWHRLRHTFCSHLAMRGAAAIEIKDLAGHQSIATTNRYMHLAPERRRTAMALLEMGRGESVARSS